jgi:hypothetical protein
VLGWGRGIRAHEDAKARRGEAERGGRAGEKTREYAGLGGLRSFGRVWRDGLVLSPKVQFRFWGEWRGTTGRKKKAAPRRVPRLPERCFRRCYCGTRP